MARRALLVGIDVYARLRPLHGCVSDTLALEQSLAFHADRTANYACKRLVSDERVVTAQALRDALQTLFEFDDEVILYFSGHGLNVGGQGYLATQDSREDMPGLPMAELLAMANQSPAREVLIILDCCHAGAFGEPTAQAQGPAFGEELALTEEMAGHFREGRTLLAATRSHESAVEVRGQGMFTQLIIGALSGAAKDVRGRVSAAAVYGYVEQAFGPWEQRPMYKSNAIRHTSIRNCGPDISAADLQRLPELFPQADALYQMDPTYEFSHKTAIPDHVKIFQVFKRYRDNRLLRTTIDPDLYFVAMHRTHVRLTPLGQYYWQLAKLNLLESDPAFSEVWRRPVPDAETVARFFHETYERLAPNFAYETRPETAKPWDDVPTRNKQLMIAVAAEVLTMLFPPEDVVAARGNTAPPTT